MPESLVRFTVGQDFDPHEVEVRLEDGTIIDSGQFYRVAAIPFHVEVDAEPGTLIQVSQSVVDLEGTVSEFSDWSNLGSTYEIPIPLPEAGLTASLICGAVLLWAVRRRRA
jgi:hypothetical protein